MTFAEYVGVDSSGHLTGGGFIGLINNVAIPIIFALAFAAFVWGIVNYFFLNGGNETKREEGRAFILWGVIGMAILFSVWGFVNIFLSTLGFA
jgi:hypothetical protein